MHVVVWSCVGSPRGSAPGCSSARRARAPRGTGRGGAAENVWKHGLQQACEDKQGQPDVDPQVCGIPPPGVTNRAEVRRDGVALWRQPLHALLNSRPEARIAHDEPLDLVEAVRRRRSGSRHHAPSLALRLRRRRGGGGAVVVLLALMVVLVRGVPVIWLKLERMLRSLGGRAQRFLIFPFHRRSPLRLQLASQRAFLASICNLVVLGVLGRSRRGSKTGQPLLAWRSPGHYESRWTSRPPACAAGVVEAPVAPAFGPPALSAAHSPRPWS